MAEHKSLRQEYLSRVCRALGAYVERDASRLRVHSCSCEGRLAVTFTIDDVELFHDLCEGRTTARRSDSPLPPAA